MTKIQSPVMPKVLTTDRLVLRCPEPGDRDKLLQIFDEETLRFYPYVGTVAERAAKLVDGLLGKWLRGELAHYAVVENSTGDVIGTAGFGIFGTHTHVGYAIAESRRGRGYAVEATEAVLKLGFEAMRIEAISALTFPENVASQGVLKRIGFELAERVSNRGFPTNRYELTRDEFLARAETDHSDNTRR